MHSVYMDASLRGRVKEMNPTNEFIPKTNFFYTENRYSHSTLSNSLLASREITFLGVPTLFGGDNIKKCANITHLPNSGQQPDY